MNVHPTAIIAAEATLHPTVRVGAYTTIGPNVKIAENTVIGPHCHVDGFTEIGPGNQLSPFVAIGCPPQDLKFGGEKSFIKIGAGNHFREFVTVHLAEGEDTITMIGDHNLFMAYVHIAHNCVVGNNVVMANCSTLAGHVKVGDRAVLGGFSGVHQFCQIGGMVMIGGMTKVTKDVPPFVKLDGNPARIVGLNSVGLRRNGVPKASLDHIRELFRFFFRSNLNVSQAKQRWRTTLQPDDPYIQEFFQFIENSNRGVYMRTRDDKSESGKG